MKTTIDVDKALAAEAGEILGTPTLKATVNQALREVVDAELRHRLAGRIRAGTLSVPTLAELARSKAPKVPIGALSPRPERPRRRTA